MNDYVAAITEDPYVYREDSGINIFKTDTSLGELFPCY